MAGDGGKAFWARALAAYGRPGAQAALLDLQDAYGGDVMQALWALAAAETGRRLTAADLDAFERATAAARAEAARLRAERRALKGAAADVYAAAKAAELAAERAVAAAAPDPASAGAPAPTDALLRANLAGVAGRLDRPPPPAALTRLIEALQAV